MAGAQRHRRTAGERAGRAAAPGHTGGRALDLGSGEEPRKGGGRNGIKYMFYLDTWV